MPRSKKTTQKVDTSKQVYKLTDLDRQIFKLGEKDPNYISDYYLKSQTSGTYWRNKTRPEDWETDANWDEERQKGYEHLLQMYIKFGDKNNPVFLWDNIEYKIDLTEGLWPIFHNNHGWLFWGWQKDFYLCNQDERTVIGGVGSSKTSAIAATVALHSILYPNYRGFCCAPLMLQANEVWGYITKNFSGTIWWDRFVVNYIQKPYPKITIMVDDNGSITERSIEILSIEKQSNKVLTLEGDEAFFDQSEQIEDLDALVLALGTRLRGQVAGREKLGKLNLIANSAPNPQLWYRYDMEKYEPKIYKSFRPTSWENPYLTKRDLANLKRRVSPTGDQATIDQWLGAERPIGDGEHFPASMVRGCVDNDILELVKRQVATNRPGFILESDPKVGVHWFEMPYEKGRQYIVIGDPGQGDPPDRNSAPIMVWDITGFPFEPARLRAFHWVYGRGMYGPFMEEFTRYAKQYHAVDRCAFDSTGVQKGFDELYFAVEGLQAEGLSSGGQGGQKAHALNALKVLMGKRLILFPYIEHLMNQLTNYILPDTKIRQDLVMCMAMSAFIIRRYYFEDVTDYEKANQPIDYQEDRFARQDNDRYERYE